MPRRVVVLGSSGFVGQKLVQALHKEQIETIGLSSKDLDLSSREAVEVLARIIQPHDSVVFASAITPDKDRKVSAFMKNVSMGEQVAAALERIPPSHFIYISSDAVFPEDLPPIDESTAPSPPTLYGVMHLAREKMLEPTLLAHKVPYLVLRPCAIYGPGDTHLSYGPNRFVQSAGTESKIGLFGNGEENRPHLHIDDFVAVIVQALSARTSGLLHVIPSSSLSFLEVAQTIRQSSSKRIELEFLPRLNRATHKYFTDSQLRFAFPQLSLRPFSEGVRDLLIPFSQLETQAADL